MKDSQRGFTLIEVLVALFILTGAILVIANAWSGNFMRIRKSNLLNNVSTLLERKMVEVEAKYKDKPLTEIPEQEGDDFGDQYPQYRWTMQSREMELPDLTPLLVGQDGGADENLIAMIKQMSETLNKSIKEVKVTVFVKSRGREIEFSATQYFMDYQQGLGGAGGLPAGLPEGAQ
ncbi:MAG: type II secretion system protein [Bdellovibrionales bacterium]